MIDDEQDETEAQEIPLPNVKSNVLAKVIEFAKHYKNEEAMTEIEKVFINCYFNLALIHFSLIYVLISLLFLPFSH